MGGDIYVWPVESQSSLACGGDGDQRNYAGCYGFYATLSSRESGQGTNNKRTQQKANSQHNGAEEEEKITIVCDPWGS